MKVYITIFLFLIFIGCNHQNIHYQTQRSYEYSLCHFDNLIVEHFPESTNIGEYGITTNFISKDSSKLCSTCFGTSSIMIYKKFNPYSFDSLLTVIGKRSVTKYYSDDTTLLSLIPFNDQIEIEGKWYKNLATESEKVRCKKNSLLTNKIPVPYFSIDKYSNENSLCNLSENFEIYVINAIPGRTKNSIEYDCECIPDNWKHGVISGYSVNIQTRDIIIWATKW